MKDFEYNILKDAITIRYQRDKDKFSMEKRFDDVERAKMYWSELCTTAEEADMKFSEKFWSTINTVTTPACSKALLLRYESKHTYQEIANINNYSRSCAEQNVKRALERILRPPFWEVVLFDKVYVKEYRKIVSPDNILNTKMSKHSKTVLTEFFDVVSKLNNTTIEPTIDNIVQYLTDITMLKRCGKTTIGEIITFFKSKGYNDVVNNWMLQVISAGLVDTQQRWVKKIYTSEVEV